MDRNLLVLSEVDVCHVLGALPSYWLAYYYYKT